MRTHVFDQLFRLNGELDWPACERGWWKAAPSKQGEVNERAVTK